ncbi:alanyl-tRNA synthetase [Natronobacterium gregoryi]|uniref:Alanyl-tRNA editing protein n=2 Tax=Natronobacterium gregoryi TaxID=44930 RepID=L0AHS1_NATGS|nr:putative metal-dependent hydrolase related to alanyl-tRNA synthetase HxxxH domain protein [Natronobacterium gregoryi SP2]ELY68671.1 threonyl/alanyl tRNA synthetase SAD [Natronobacterium gregoryi SP2]PLK18779.1 alanyl-tRNA editing protein [Natronobacterium gregoryi SP2]SFJ63651.1 alanyl-tRNA synthetase [Natronobacterium gregoryi]
MSGQLAAAEPYATRFETEVTSIDGNRVWLERSYFYGESAGQPADRGTIDGIGVVDVQLVDGNLVHVLAQEPSFRVGARVLCSIDWSFRMYCMRAHTASHVLYGAARQLLADLEYGGVDIGEESVLVDLETSTTVDDETLIELDELVNRAVWESRPVSWDDAPVSEARERDDVVFDEGAEDGAVEKGRVRLVTIGGEEDNGGNGNGLASGTTVTVAGDTTESRDAWDVTACGGTHVRNTREIGPVTVLDRFTPESGTTRIELAVGPRAIERREAEKRAALASRRLLGTPLEAASDELARLDAESDVAERLRSLVGRLETDAS